MSMHKGTVIVTGAAGFIGSHVCQALLSRGQSVVGVDNFDPFYNVNLKKHNLQLIEQTAQRSKSTFVFHQLDLCDEPAVRRLLAEYPLSDSATHRAGIIHLAAKAGVRPSIADPVAYTRANLLATSILLEESRRVACPRFILASSSSVYGNNPKVPFAEDDDVSFPISPYAATKRACELLAAAHFALNKTPIAALRFFTVYGPRQRPDLAISAFLDKIARDQDIPMFGDGSTSRDYTYIDDIVAGVLNSLDRIDRFGCRIWNLGGNEPVTLSEMIAVIGRVVGKTPKVKPLPRQPGDVERTYADLTRSAAELDYRPSTRFEEGVRKQWEWAKDFHL